MAQQVPSVDAVKNYAVRKIAGSSDGTTSVYVASGDGTQGARVLYGSPSAITNHLTGIASCTAIDEYCSSTYVAKASSSGSEVYYNNNGTDKMAGLADSASAITSAASPNIPTCKAVHDYVETVIGDAGSGTYVEQSTATGPLLYGRTNGAEATRTVVGTASDIVASSPNIPTVNAVYDYAQPKGSYATTSDIPSLPISLANGGTGATSQTSVTSSTFTASAPYLVGKSSITSAINRQITPQNLALGMGHVGLMPCATDFTVEVSAAKTIEAGTTAAIGAVTSIAQCTLAGYITAITMTDTAQTFPAALQMYVRVGLAYKTSMSSGTDVVVYCTNTGSNDVTLQPCTITGKRVYIFMV